MECVFEQNIGSFLEKTDKQRKDIAGRRLQGVKSLLAVGTIAGTGITSQIVSFASNKTLGNTKKTTPTPDSVEPKGSAESGFKGNNKQAAEKFMDELDGGTLKDGSMEGVQKSAIGITANVYGIFRSVGLIIILILSIVAIVKLAGSSGQGQNDGKSGMVKVALALLALGALGSFVALCFDIGGTLFSS